MQEDRRELSPVPFSSDEDKTRREYRITGIKDTMRSTALQVTTTTTLLLAFSATRLLALDPSQNDNHDIEPLALERREPLLYNPPGYDSDDRAGNPRASVGESSGSSVVLQPSPTQVPHASAINPVQPATTTDCQQPLATFFITHAAILSCPLCSTGGGGGGGAGQEDSNSSGNSSAKAPTSQSSQQTGALHSQANMIENLTVTIKNPSTTSSFGAGSPATDIHCHVDWDTSVAAANKFPIAKQMECDHDEQNQLNAVVEKQAKGAAAGFYLFVWNK